MLFRTFFSRPFLNRQCRTESWSLLQPLLYFRVMWQDLSLNHHGHLRPSTLSSPSGTNPGKSLAALPSVRMRIVKSWFPSVVAGRLGWFRNEQWERSVIFTGGRQQPARPRLPAILSPSWWFAAAQISTEHWGLKSAFGPDFILV